MEKINYTSILSSICVVTVLAFLSFATGQISFSANDYASLALIPTSTRINLCYANNRTVRNSRVCYRGLYRLWCQQPDEFVFVCQSDVWRIRNDICNEEGYNFTAFTRCYTPAMLSFVDQRCFGRNFCRAFWSELPRQTTCPQDQQPYSQTTYLCLNRNNYRNMNDLLAVIYNAERVRSAQRDSQPDFIDDYDISQG